MKRLIGCTAVLCLVALLAALTVGCGGAASSSVLAYVANRTAGAGAGFTVFNVNNSGTLTPSSISPINTAAPRVLQITPNGRWAFFLDAAGNNIYGFRRTGGGAFDTAVTGSPFVLTGGASSLAISSNSQFLYVALPGAIGGGAIAIFSIDQSTGTLTQVGSNQVIGFAITQLIASPDGTVLYGLAPAQQTVVTFTLNSGTGLVTGPNTFSVGPTPPCFQDPVGATPPCVGMILSANGSFLYVVDETQTGTIVNVATGALGQSPDIYGFATATTGILTPLAGSPFHENADLVTQLFPVQPVAGVTSNDSRFLFIANQGSHNISVFRIGTLTGELTEVLGSLSGGVSTQSPFDCGVGCSTPDFLAVSKANNALYVLDSVAGKIFQFGVDQNTGRLRQLSPASVDAGATPSWITIR